jgi:hypothetical protein
MKHFVLTSVGLCAFCSFLTPSFGFAENAEDRIKTGQASAVVFSAADHQTTAQIEEKTGFLSHNRGIEYRPSLYSEWFAVQSTREDKSSLQASWVGLKAEMDAAIVRFPIMEIRAEGSVFRSIAPLTTAAMDGAATDAKLGAYALFKANTAKFGIPMVRLFAGYQETGDNLLRESIS